MFIRKSSIPVKLINGPSDKMNIKILIVPNLASVRWWVKDFTIKFGVNNPMMTVRVE